MSRFVLTPLACWDLEEIGDFIARSNPRAAARLIRTLEEKCQILAQFPSLGSCCEDLAPGLRSFAVGNYVIFYRPIDQGIQVIRVLHGGRNLPSLFRA